jgi:AraC family transcriptional regulator of adaptative response/methylated-DNA-[protein]-cysteine methyltransferase
MTMISEPENLFINTRRKPRTGKKMVMLNYGTAPTPFGPALLGWIGARVCHLVFCDNEAETRLRRLMALWPAAFCKQDDKAAAKLTREIFSSPNQENKIPLLVQGSSFQIKVWQALLNTNLGQTISYSRLAQMAGSPKAQRAVGSAMAANPIAFLIPCHRVIRKSGALGNYGGGTERKQNILNWEARIG